MAPCITCGTEHVQQYDHAGEPSLAPCVKALVAEKAEMAERVEALEASLHAAGIPLLVKTVPEGVVVEGEAQETPPTEPPAAPAEA